MTNQQAAMTDGLKHNPGLTIFTAQDVADYTGYQPVTIYRMASEGRLPSFRIKSFLRFEKGMVDKFLQREARRMMDGIAA